MNIHYVKYILPELVIILAFILLIQTNLAKVDVVIKADAIGYYDYLPSLFIHHDLVRKNKPVRTNPVFYKRIDKEGVYVNYKGFKVDKYPVGTALLQWPFFYVTYLTTPRRGNPTDGYQKPFQRAVLYATLFYLFLGIFFLRKTLELYDIKKSVIIFSQVLLIFATGVTNYANFDAGFSHVYSLFAISAFFYFVRSFFIKSRLKYFILACLFLGLILLIRQINILVVLFVPFLAGESVNLKKGFFHLLHHPKVLLAGLFLTVVLFFIQCLAWYLQTGHILLYSYQGEGFHFLNPQFVNILFSYRKGLFVYTPVLFFSLFGLIWLAYRRKFYMAFTWLAFFTIITYMFSSWHSWDYGASYGSRVFIDYYGMFFILLALLINEIPKMLKTGIILLSVLTIPVNLIQSYQYKDYILHWTDMNKEKYWEVFLKTESRYKGLLWRKKYDEHQYAIVKKIFIGDIAGSQKNKLQLIYKTNSMSIPDFNRVSLIRISFANKFAENNDAKIIVSISDAATGKTDYGYDPYLIHFARKQLGEWQNGCYNYAFKPMSDDKEKIITVKLFTERQQENILKSFQIEFLVHH